jgi:predicted nucleotidyltransferase
MGVEMNLARRRAEYSKALDRALNRVVSRLAAIPQVERVIPFGSYAAGRRDLFTAWTYKATVHSS